MCKPRLSGLIGLLIGLGLIGVLRPRRFLGARGHPGIVLGRAGPRRYTGRHAAHPARQVRQMLTRGLPGARRQRNAGKAEEGPFKFRDSTIHFGVMPPYCGDRDAQSRPGCDAEASREPSWLVPISSFLPAIRIADASSKRQAT